MVRPLLLATVHEDCAERARESAALAAKRADLVEIRLDAIEDPDPAGLIAASPLPVVATCRSVRDGGSFKGPESARLKLLERAVAAGAAFVDVEEHSAAALGDVAPARRIVSFHDFEGTPEDLDPILDRIAAHSPDIAKIVTTARGPRDVVAVLKLLSRRRMPLAAHTMGAAGRPGRILASVFGTAIVYGAARLGSPGGPGQPTLARLIEDYGLDRSRAGHPFVALLGGSLAHSVSPRMINRTLLAEGIEGLYVPWDGPDVAELVRALEDLGAVGAAVTVPYKGAAIGEMSGLDRVAGRIGAVNTVSFRDGGSTGSNTDLEGALGAIRAARPALHSATAVLIGAGGAARAIAAGLVDEGVRLLVVNRSRARADDLVAGIGGEVRTLDEIDPDGVDILVNATPVGQWPREGESPVPASFLRPGMVVMDAVYNPEETRLLREARHAGATVVPGIEMLARQAARQVGIWFGRAVSLDRLRAEGRAALALAGRTILLIGMRGAGKTTVGGILADRLGRPFVDLDRAVEERAGKSIEAIFLEDGAAAFRGIEREALLGELVRPGRVLAVGGGAVDAPEAAGAVRGAGPHVVYLEAPEAVLADRIRGSGRPSLTGRPPESEVGDILRERAPIYRALAGWAVDSSTGTPDAVADRVLDRLSY